MNGKEAFMKCKKLLLVLVLTGVGLCVLGFTFAKRSSNTLEGSGTVEARNIRVGSKVGGRISEVRVREGESVKAGQILVTFDEQELLAALEQARGAAARARANLERMERGSRAEEIAEARAAMAVAAATLAQMRNGYPAEQVAQAKEDVERARADASNAETAFQRLEPLTEGGVVSRQQRDDAETSWKMATARLRGTEQRLAELQRGYRAEEIAAADARHQQAIAVFQKTERGSRAEDVAAARAEVEQADGALREAEARYRERQVVAPAEAVVEVLDIRPGDLVAPNSPIATLLEIDQVYVRIYVPETQIGRVRVGQTASVRVDSFPKHLFPATVVQINQQAEFLPRNVQTREERVHQVFGVKLIIGDGQGRIRSGMAADITLHTEAQ
jgi:multidrug resistance efflux pump